MVETSQSERFDVARFLTVGTWRTVAVAAATVSVLGRFGSVHWSLDVFSAFRIQYLLVAVALAVVGLLLRDRTIGVLAALLFVPNLIWVAPMVVGGTDEAVPGAEPLRVMNFNVYQFNPSFDAVLDYLAEADADVVVLHEIDSRWRRVISEAGLPFEVVDVSERGYVFDTIMLVDAESVEIAGIRRVGIDWKAHPLVDLRYMGQTVSVLGIHPPSPVTAARARIRDEQLVAVGEWAASQPHEVVVVGDFNATPWSSGYRGFVEASGLRSALTGAGWIGTWPDMPLALRIPIDHLFHSDGLVVTEVEVGPTTGSDHHPVLVELAPAA